MNDRVAYDRKRNRRARSVRAKTVQVYVRGLADPQRRLELEPRDPEAPRTRGECVDGPRPCPWVSCRHHLYLDVSPRTGAIKLNFPDLEVWEMEHSCALDIADDGGATLDAVGAAMNLTRERVRQVEMRALRTVRLALARKGIRAEDMAWETSEPAREWDDE